MSYKGIKNIIVKSATLLAISPIIVSIFTNDIAKASMVRGAQGIRGIANSAVRASSVRNGSSTIGSISGVTSRGTNLANTGSKSISGTANRSTTTLAGTANVRYTPSTSEKILGGIAIGVGTVSVIGTAVGLGLTEKQYIQTKETYDDVVNRNYRGFYEEREDYMADLFGEWGVPLPDKYKNPILNPNKANKVTSGFTMGKGE